MYYPDGTRYDQVDGTDTVVPFTRTPGKGRLPFPNVARLLTFAVRGLTPPPLIFGSYGRLETLLILVTKKGEKLNFQKTSKMTKYS